MAEAVGLCSSIITILDLAKKATDFLGDVKGATDDDRGKLLIEILGLQDLLVLLNNELENRQHPDPFSVSVELLLGPEGPLTSMRKLLQKMLVKLDAGEGWRRHTNALKWPFQKEELLGHLNTIERCKSLISLALNNDHLNVSRQTRIDVGALREEIRKIHEKQRAHELQNKIREEQAVLEWLSPLNFWAKQKDTYERRQQGTGQWFLQSESFTKWRDGLLSNGGQTLFCSGMPGAGKTVLASLVIHHLEEVIAGDPSPVGLGYVYCDYKMQNQTAGILGAAILRQLVSQLPSLPKEIVALHSCYKSRGVRPSLKDVSKYLKEVITHFNKVFLVIDALDECPEEERDSLIELTRSLGSKVHIMVTSRQVRGIEELVDGEIQDIQATDEDVGAYVKAKIQASRNVRTALKDPRAAPSLLEEIISTIVAKAQGMFLLAQLHVNTVCWSATLEGVQKALKELPDELSTSYNITMERIQNYPDKEGRRLAVLALTWIMCSIGPLTLAELQHALATEDKDTGLNEDGLPGESIVITLCAGLVILENQSKQVRLVHYTTQEYFERDSSKLLPTPHTLLAKTCLTYLSFDVFEVGRCEDIDTLREYKEDFGLLHYASVNWFTHVRASEEFNGVEDAELTELVTNFLNRPQKLTFALQSAGEFQPTEGKPGPLPTAIFLGLGGAVKALLANDTLDLNNQTYWNKYSPLHLAIGKATEDPDPRIPLLLPRGNGRTGSINKKQHSAFSSLCHAEIEANRAELVRLLLCNRDLDPNISDLDGITPLCAAISMGHTTIVKLLLDDPRVNPNLVDDCGTSILAYAAGKGYLDIVQELLDPCLDIDPNVRDEEGRTALYLACALGPDKSRKGIVSSLLHNNHLGKQVDPSLPDNDGFPPLCVAAVQGAADVIRLLLDHPKVDPNVADNSKRRTALSLAAEKGHAEVVRLLLEDPTVNPDLPDSDGRTPLSWAAEGGCNDVIRAFLTARFGDCVNPNLQDNKGMTPLCWASGAGHLEAVLILLELGGVDPNLSDHEGRTPLAYAASENHTEIVETLLGHKSLKPNLPDKDGRTPLDWAAEYGHTSVVRLLLDHEAVKERRSTQLENYENCTRLSMQYL